jgi:hypothetical protein
MDSLTDEVKRLIQNKGVLERIHSLLHPKRKRDDNNDDQDPTEVEVDSEEGTVKLRRLGVR